MKRALAALLFVAVAMAAPSAPTITQRQINTLTKKWTAVLQLNDWQIQTHIVRLDELPPHTAGRSTADHTLKVVRIEVLDPRDYAAMAAKDGVLPLYGKEISEDIEDTIIHELVHVRLQEIGDGDDVKMLNEMMVVRLTKALEAARQR